MLGICSLLLSQRSLSQISLGVSTSNTTFCVGSPVDFSSLLTGGLIPGTLVDNFSFNAFGPINVNSAFNYDTPPLICGQNYNIEITGIYSYWGTTNCNQLDRFRDAESYYNDGILVDNLAPNLITGVYSEMTPISNDTPPQTDHVFNYNFTGTGSVLHVAFGDSPNGIPAYQDNCGGLTYNITVAPTTYSYVWNFGDNTGTVTTTTNTPPPHTYTTAGTYNVTCTATPVSENNNSNCSVTSSMSVTINPQPTISIAGPTSVYENGTAILTATSNATDIVWNDPDGNQSTGNTISGGVGTYSAIATDPISQCGSEETQFTVTENTFTIDKSQLLGSAETTGGYTSQTITYTITLTNDSENSETYNITDNLPSTFIIDAAPSGLTLNGDLAGTVTMAPNSTQTFTYIGSYLVTGDDQTQSIPQEPNIACATNIGSGITRCDETVMYISFGCPGNINMEAANAQSIESPQELTMWYQCHKPFDAVTQIKFKVHYPDFLRVAPIQSSNFVAIPSGVLSTPVNAETPSQAGYKSVEITATFSATDIGVAIQNIFNVKFEVIDNAALALLPQNTYDLFVESLGDASSNYIDMTRSGVEGKVLTQIAVLEILNGPWANIPNSDFTYIVNPCNHKVTVSGIETGGYNRWEFNDPNNPFVPIWGAQNYTWQYQNTGSFNITHFYINENGIGASTTKTIIMNAVNYDYPNGINITSNSQVIQDLNGDGKIKVAGPVTVQSGVNYLINNKTIQFVDDLLPFSSDQGLAHSGIVVNTNAILRVKNSTLKGIEECPSMWQGIQVYGYVVPKNGNGNGSLNTNGKVILSNNSFIKDAEIGVALYRVNRPFGNTLEYGIAVLDATNTTFLNNRVGVAFQGRNYVANISTVTNCTFRCDNVLKDFLKYPVAGTDAFIIAAKVKDVKITANSFLGNLNLADNKRATGIRSYDASYQVISSSPQNVSNTFTDLTSGIDIYTTGGANKIIRIKNNRFTNTFQGITANGSSFDEISFNTFNVPRGTLELASWGVNVNASGGFLITENTFNATQTTNRTFGLIAKNISATSGKVYKNNFNGNFFAATQSEQKNYQLQIKCNKYIGTNNYDWTVTSGILANQGTCDVLATSPAGNTFGTCGTIDQSQIWKNPFVPGFEYRTQAVLAPNCKSANVNVFICNSNYSPNTSCPTQVALPCNNCFTEVLSTYNLLPNGNEKKAKQIELINVLNNENKKTELRTLLTTSSDLNDLKMLIPTLIEEQEYVEARVKLTNLNRIDNETEQFYRFYDVLNNLGETNRSRKDLTQTEKQTIEAIAFEQVEVSINAESLLADINDAPYFRIPENVQLASGMGLAQNNNDDNEDEMMQNAHKFSIFPNPSAGEVNIKFENETMGQLTIVDALGRIQFSAEVNNSDEQVEQEIKTQLNQGVYVLKFVGYDGFVSTKQIVVNN